MNFRHLRYFVAASEHGSFRKAGAALGVQESTISRRVRDMEDGLGSALFHRHSGGVCLTVAGQRLLSKAQTVLRYINEGAEIVDAVGRGTEGQLRVGIFSSLASGFLQDLLRTFAAEHPIHVEVVDGNPAEHVAAIRQFAGYRLSDRDAGVAPMRDHLPLVGTCFRGAAGSTRSCRKEEVKWQDLAHETFIVSDVPPGQEVHDYLVQRVADLGHHPKIQAQFVGRDNLLTLVAIGSGLTVMSEAATAAHVPGICYRPIIGEVLPFNGVWSPKNDNPALRRFVSMAKTMARRQGVDL
jgi:DNA-binding transcriptional LysR family regulator